MSKADLLPLVTRERMLSHLSATDNDPELAFALYEWNARAAAEVLLFTGLTEVIVRNALDRSLSELAERRGWRSWFDSAPLDHRGRADIDKARSRARKAGRVPEAHGKGDR